MYVQTSEKNMRMYQYKHKPSPALMRFSTCSALFTISSFSPATNTPRWQKLKNKNKNQHIHTIHAHQI